MILCSVTGTERYSGDLVQGGMEIPCTHSFTSSTNDLMKKTKRRLEELNFSTISEAFDLKQEQSLVEAIEGRHVKTEQKESEICAQENESENQLIWVKFQDITLSEDNQVALLSRGLLQDQHINMAQRILKKQFVVMDCDFLSYQTRIIVLVYQIAFNFFPCSRESLGVCIQT
jgi:hypothetical protein